MGTVRTLSNTKRGPTASESAVRHATAWSLVFRSPTRSTTPGDKRDTEVKVKLDGHATTTLSMHARPGPSETRRKPEPAWTPAVVALRTAKKRERACMYAGPLMHAMRHAEELPPICTGDVKCKLCRLPGSSAS